MAIGALHLVATPLLQSGFAPLISAGMLDAVADDPARESAVWFAATGLAMVGLGDVARTTRNRTGRPPARFGGWVLATGALITAALPGSPGWLVMVIGAAALREEAADRRSGASSLTRTRSRSNGPSRASRARQGRESLLSIGAPARAAKGSKARRSARASPPGR